MMKYSKKGISLIVLVITIIVVMIIAGAIILNLTNNEIIDNAKKAKFMSDFKTVESGVTLYSSSKYDAATGKFELPLKGYLTDDDKTYIKGNVPTLSTKIEELSGNLDTVNLAWISSENIGIKLSNEKEEKGYILDVATGQIYDYNGDVFEGKRWHTLDGGVAISDADIPVVADEMWDGWIRLTLYYPSNSTAREWRIGTEGEVRLDPMLMWQSYTGPITIPLDRTKDVWIKYKIDDQEVIIPPAGTLLVDISPDKTGSTNVKQVNVTINFDENATTKEYRVGSSGWMTYTNPFIVTENCIIEARANKKENIYDINGALLVSRDISGKDAVYIGNIGIDSSEPGGGEAGSGSDTLVAPTITRLAPENEGEKAKIRVTYPVESDKKIYKLNYGVEQNYSEDISVTKWGTYIIAYYYDLNGIKSKSTSIYVNDTTAGATPEPPKSHDPFPPKLPGDAPPSIPVDVNHVVIPAPTINISPTTIVEQVSLSITSPTTANKTYIKLGRYGDYQEYSGSIIVRENMEVYAYYRTYSGEKSEIANALVNNIKKTNKPYVVINANPYPWSGSYGVPKVTITIQYSDTTKIEYSEDGIIFVPYTGPFDVTKNERVYARGTNTNGITETYLDITNIGSIKQPPLEKNLSISINVEPEPTLSITRAQTSKISIEYDINATEKYYRINKLGDLLEYTGPFNVTSNCTVYAYAKSLDGKGTASKIVDNLLDGISMPLITTNPSSNVQASKVNVDIQYDKYATIKRYSLNGGALRDYSSNFDVTENETVIYAYSENAAGQKSEATFKILNIVKDPPILALDKGKYYILKLSYPSTSVGREYKWKETGEWKGYKEAGILLVKPEYKNDLISGETLVKVEDDNGNLVTFTGDYYLIDVPISELFENIFMRWDRVSLGAPQVTLNTTEPSKQVVATIIYNPALVTKQYRILNPGEELGQWQDYTAPITISKNNAIIYAKGMDDSEVWTAEVIKKITNIDEIQPVIALTADLDSAQQKVAVKVSVTDDISVGKVKWAPGIQGESYFISSGTEILNNTVVNISSNGYYTFYAEDRVGNKQIYTLNITNVDLTPPVIDIQISPETEVGITTDVIINFGDSTLKQYKVGSNNVTWTNYTNAFILASNTVLANNWQNADGTVTIYAKGKDTAGNEVIVQKKILSLDLDKPIMPVITTSSGYAILSSYGASYNKATTITYDTRTDIDNYYSIDNGITWQVYTGEFDMITGTVIAKSVKKNTGLEVSVSKTVSMPTDALKPEAYDGNDTTYINGVNQHLQVDTTMHGKNIRIKTEIFGGNIVINFLDANRNVLTTTGYIGTVNQVYTIPFGTKWIQYYPSQSQQRLYEIQSMNEPTFSATNEYMLLTADPTKQIKEPYQMVNISYFVTSTERLYRIGTTGDWLNYNDQSIKVIQNQTIYAKGIDQYGNETRIISSYTANIPDAMKKEAFDGDDNTYITPQNQNMKVDTTMHGKKIRIKTLNLSGNTMVKFLGISRNEISNTGYITGETVHTIPTGTYWIQYYPSNSGNRLYEIQSMNEPTFSATNGYMFISADVTKAIREPYQTVNINYFPTSVQKLYKVGATGDWLSYNQPIKVNHGLAIYAKGIDQYGNETRITSSYTVNAADAIKKEAYDGNDLTYITGGTQLIQIDSSLQGKGIRIKTEIFGGNIVINFLDINKNVIGSSGYIGTVNTVYTMPMGTYWLQYVPYSTNQRLYELQPWI